MSLQFHTRPPSPSLVFITTHHIKFKQQKKLKPEKYPSSLYTLLQTHSVHTFIATCIHFKFHQHKWAICVICLMQCIVLLRNKKYALGFKRGCTHIYAWQRFGIEGIRMELKKELLPAIE